MDRHALQLCLERGMRVVLIAIVSVLSSHQIALAETAARTSIKVGSELDYPPYALVTENGEADGFSVDLIKAVAKVMGSKVIFNVDTWSAVKEQLERGEIDVLPHVYYSLERDVVFDFSVSHTSADAAIFIRKGEYKNLSVDDLRQMNVITMRADWTQEYLTAQGFENLTQVDTVPDALRLLSSGKQDVAFVPHLVGQLLVNDLGLHNLESTGDLVPVGRGFAFAVREGDTALLQRLNEALAIVKSTGTYDQIYEKWFGLVAPRGISKDVIARYVVWSVGLIVVLIILTLTWILVLRRTVLQKTVELQNARDLLGLRVEERTSELQKEVNEREKIAQRLLASEERFRDIAESSSDWFWEMGPDLRFSYFTESFRDIVGIDPNSLIGKSRTDVVVPQENPEKWESHLLDLENHRPFRNYEYEFQRPDQTTQHISISGKPIIDANGNFKGYRGTGSNITKYKLAEVSLRKLSQAIEQSPNAVFITDTKGAIEYVNLKFVELTGYTSEEAIGRNPRILKSNETPRELYFDLWQTIQSGNEWRGEIKDRRKDGNHFWAYETIAPIEDGNGIITHYVATHEDISERKDAELAVQIALEQAEIANRAKSDLMANMSHELRTPLNAIIGFSQSMQEETFGPVGSAKNSEYLNDIHQSGQHLLELINDILDASAIEAGALELQEENINLTDVVDAAVRLVKPRAVVGQVRVTASLDPEIPLIFADRRRLMQVMLNLLSNAVKFTPEDGEVYVGARLNDDGSLAVTVDDNGIGMDAKEIEKAMSQFGQVDSGLDRKHEGTGLGLPLTKGLIDLHGGTLEIKSKKDNGTLITVTFPKERVIRTV